MATALPDASSSTGATQASETEAQFKAFVVAVRDALAQLGDPIAKFGVVQNVSLALSVAGSALTIALKDRAGADPTSTSGKSSEAVVPFRNVTVATGDFSVLNQNAAASLVVSSGSTLGAVANVPFRLWIVAFNDAGTFRLGVINCLSTAAGFGAGRNVTALYPLKAWGIASSTAEGGAGAADNAQTFYTGTAVTSKPYTVLGYATWEAGLATPGTWSAGPTRIQLFGPGVPLPGDILQVQRQDAIATIAAGVTIPADNTIPQNTEGDSYLSKSITPSSAANVLSVSSRGHLSSNQVSQRYVWGLFQDSTANAITVSTVQNASADFPQCLSLDARLVALTTSSTSFSMRGGSQTAGTMTFNGVASAAIYGGVLNSFIDVAELMA